MNRDLINGYGSIFRVVTPILVTIAIAILVAMNGKMDKVDIKIDTLGSYFTNHPVGKPAGLYWEGTTVSRLHVVIDNANPWQFSTTRIEAMGATSAVLSGTGTVSLPSLAWTDESSTGLWFPATGNIGFASLGTEVLRTTTTGLKLLGGYNIYPATDSTTALGISSAAAPTTKWVTFDTTNKRVGIGVTPLIGLHLATVSAWSGINSSLLISDTSTNVPGISFQGTGNVKGIIRLQNGPLAFFVNNAVGNFVAADQKMTILATGLVGIGTTAPAVKLHQDGGNATATYHKFTAGTTTGLLSTDGFDVGIDASGNAEIRQRENLPMYFYTNNALALTLAATGAATFASTITSTQYKLSALNTAPANATDTGVLGEIRIVADYIYVCTATNVWVRAALTTW